MLTFPKLFLGAFGLLSSIAAASACYCGIGFQAGYVPSSFSASYASWASPSSIGAALTASSSPSLTTWRNGHTTPTGGLTWNTSPGNIYGNTYAVDGIPASFVPQTISGLNLPATVTTPVTSSPYLDTQSYYLAGTLSGCVIPLGQSSFVTSIQFAPFAYFEASNSIASYHRDSILSFVQTAGSASQTSVPVYSNEAGYGADTFFTAEFALTLGTNYFWIVVANTDIVKSATGGCPFIYQYKVTCTQGAVKGDPQFTGFRGQNYQIHGQAGTVYNILSTPSFQYNALFSFLNNGRCRLGTLCFSHPGNYFGSVGMLIHDRPDEQPTAIKVIAGAVDEGMKVSINDIVLAPSDHSLTIGLYTLQYPNQFELTLESNELNLKLSNSDYFINQDVSIGTGLLTSIAEHKRVKRVNETRAEEMEAELPHGLLGQTWQMSQHNNRWKFIAGHLYDYIVDGLTGKDFKYNRFQY